MPIFFARTEVARKGKQFRAAVSTKGDQSPRKYKKLKYQRLKLKTKPKIEVFGCKQKLVPYLQSGDLPPTQTEG